MISISDNTASDHLLAFAGRARVEVQLSNTHHSLPNVNSPFFTTRELFAVKLLASDRERAALRASRGGQRRARMEALAKRLVFGSIVDARLATWSSPNLLDFEWFASAIDVCNAMATIAVRSKFDPKAEILAALSKKSWTPPRRIELDLRGLQRRLRAGRPKPDPVVAAQGWHWVRDRRYDQRSQQDDRRVDRDNRRCRRSTASCP